MWGLGKGGKRQNTEGPGKKKLNVYKLHAVRLILREKSNLICKIVNPNRINLFENFYLKKLSD